MAGTSLTVVKNQLDEITVFQQMASASVGGLLTSLSMNPMDVVKVRLQKQMQPFANGQCYLYYNGLLERWCTSCMKDNSRIEECEWFSRPGKFNGTTDAFRKIIKNEGILSLWSGLSTSIMHSIPTTIIYYSVYDSMNTYVKKKYGDYLLSPLFCGAFARTFAVTIVSPIEMCRTKMQSEKLSYKNLCYAIKNTVLNEGLLSLWRGWSATLSRDVPFSAIYWMSYEGMNKKLRELYHKKEKTFTINATCGAVCGAFTAAITTPFDVVKTQREITLGNIEKSDKKSKNVRTASMIEIFKQIYHNLGPTKLFTGVIPRIAKIAPACTIMISSYEYFKNYFVHLNNINK
uniref:Mitochondrial carrier protein n=1 Tax=Parastrongyloides trichosuri TaxID=131310 RepID=A0A0N4Z2M6_PARTI